MKRRELLLLLCGATTAPRAPRAQQKMMPVIGFLDGYWPPPNLSDVGRGPFAQGLNQAGFVEGQNVSVERRWAEGIMIGSPRSPPTSSPARSV